MSLWSQAKYAAEQTPPSRNRSADFFRAAAIITVIFGHWVVNVPRYVDGNLQFTELLVVQPWTQYATWFLQVMPIFFFVGGYSNAASWASAQRDPSKQRVWQATRLKRLLLPIMPLVLIWSVFAGIAEQSGLDHDLIRNATRAALIPIWFLAVYIMVTIAVPASMKFWERYGIYSVVFLIAIAALVDILAFVGGLGWLRWTNYAFIWLGMHQLGYWWHSGIQRKSAPVFLLIAGIASLYLLTGPLGYPTAMVSVPGADVSNSRPPTIAMLAIGLTQAGIILLLADRVSKLMNNTMLWALVILVSQRIMTVYLWHMTTLLALVGLSLVAGGFGLQAIPGSSEWWLSRPVWLVALTLALLPFIFLFGRLEVGSRQTQSDLPGPIRSIIGACLACAGLTYAALDGTHANNAVGINLVPVVLVIVGVVLSISSPRRRK